MAAVAAAMGVAAAAAGVAVASIAAKMARMCSTTSSTRLPQPSPAAPIPEADQPDDDLGPVSGEMHRRARRRRPARPKFLRHARSFRRQDILDDVHAQLKRGAAAVPKPKAGPLWGHGEAAGGAQRCCLPLT